MQRLADLTVDLERVAAQEARIVAPRVQHLLESWIRTGVPALPQRYQRTLPDTYARRLLHRDPGGRFTMVLMTWGPGQGTPLHDHAGTWCVEAVLQGEMEVTQYDLVEQDGLRYRFVQRSATRAGVGTSGCLIPPFEYHVLRNALPEAISITLHVYGGEMLRCAAFVPQGEGWFLRTERALTYHD